MLSAFGLSGCVSDRVQRVPARSAIAGGCPNGDVAATQGVLSCSAPWFHGYTTWRPLVSENPSGIETVIAAVPPTDTAQRIAPPLLQVPFEVASPRPAKAGWDNDTAAEQTDQQQAVRTDVDSSLPDTAPPKDGKAGEDSGNTPHEVYGRVRGLLAPKQAITFPGQGPTMVID